MRWKMCQGGANVLVFVRVSAFFKVFVFVRVCVFSPKIRTNKEIYKYFEEKHYVPWYSFKNKRPNENTKSSELNRLVN